MLKFLKRREEKKARERAAAERRRKARERAAQQRRIKSKRELEAFLAETDRMASGWNENRPERFLFLH